MSTDIDQRTAALLFFIKKYPPGRHRSPSERMRLCKIDVSHLSVFAHFFQVGAVRTIPVLVCDIQHSPCPLCRLQHFLCFRISSCHRLFAHDILARLHGSDGNFGMRSVRCRHIYHIKIFLYQFPVVSEYLCVTAAELFFCLLCLLRDYVTECDHFIESALFHCRKMLCIGNSPASYDTCT